MVGTSKKETVKKQAPLHWGNLLTKIVFVLIIIFAAWSFYSYTNVNRQLELLSSPEGQQQVQEKEVRKVVSKVSRHMLLPEDVLPTVATVTDVETLKEDQPFFNGALDGDQLLVYVDEQKAIIYRPSEDIIVNVGPISVADTGTTTSQ